MDYCTTEETNIELWKSGEGYYSPSIHVTAGNGIGIDCGGHVIVAPIEKWHELGKKFLFANEQLPRWKYKLAMWLLEAQKERL
jgi:hypothetical protein